MTWWSEWTVGRSSYRCEEPYRESRRAAAEDHRDHADLEAKERRGGHDPHAQRDRIDAGERPAHCCAPRPEDVPREKNRQIDDDADDGGGDRRQRRGEPELSVRRLDQRSACENEQERWQESEERRDARARDAGKGQRLRTEQRLAPAADEAD